MRVLPRGYVPDSELPYKKGDRVRLPAGTLVQETGGRTVRLTRAQTVTIDHWLNGSDATVGFHWVASGAKELRFETSADARRVFDAYGTGQLEELRQYLRMEDNDSGSPVRALYLPLTNPCIRWVGSGGYWKSVDITHLPPKEPLP